MQRPSPPHPHPPPGRQMRPESRELIRKLGDEFIKGENEDIERYNSDAQYRQMMIEEKLAFAHHRHMWLGKCFASLCAILVKD